MSGSKTTPIRQVFLLVLALFVIGYGGWSFRHMFHGPEIILESPADGSATDGKVTVSGYAKDAVHTTIDGRTLYIDASGHFQEDIVLPKGPAIITLYAKDRFGRETTEEVRLYAQ
jgi:hypothetical protein